MGVGWKKFLSVYGIKFAGFYLLAFFLLVTFAGASQDFSVFGDIVINVGSGVIFLPFASSLLISAFMLIVFEIYRNIKK